MNYGGDGLQTANLDCELATLLGYENCYVDIQLSNGPTNLLCRCFN